MRKRTQEKMGEVKGEDLKEKKRCRDKKERGDAAQLAAPQRSKRKLVNSSDAKRECDEATKKAKLQANSRLRLKRKHRRTPKRRARSSSSSLSKPQRLEPAHGKQSREDYLTPMNQSESRRSKRLREDQHTKTKDSHSLRSHDGSRNMVHPIKQLYQYQEEIQQRKDSWDESTNVPAKKKRTLLSTPPWPQPRSREGKDPPKSKLWAKQSAPHLPLPHQYNQSPPDRPAEQKWTFPLTVRQHYDDCEEQCFEAPRHFKNTASAPDLGPASAPLGFQQWPSRFSGPLRFDGPGHSEGPRYDMPHQGVPQHLENFPGQQSCVEFNPQHNLQPSIRLVGPPIYENPMAPQQNFPMAPQRFPEPMNPFPHRQWLSVVPPGQQNIQQPGPEASYNPAAPAVGLQQPVMENMNQPLLPRYPVRLPQQNPQVGPPENPLGQVYTNSLMLKLISSVIKPSQPEATPTSSSKSFSAPPAVPPVEEKEEEEEVDIPDLTNFSINNLKQRYESVVSTLHSGKQCSLCSMRFSDAKTSTYADHLDWHFRKNHASKKVTPRGWYCCLTDWIGLEEITDPQECAKSQFFEKGMQKKQPAAKEKELQSIRATKGQVREYCETCQEPFELYWVEEEEDWFLKNAVTADNKNFHSTCFTDYEKYV